MILMSAIAILRCHAGSLAERAVSGNCPIAPPNAGWPARGGCAKVVSHREERMPNGFPIDLATVNWLYVAILAVFVFVASLIGNFVTFGRKLSAAVLTAILFAAAFVAWSYYPHGLPLPTTLNPPAPPVATAPPASAAPAAPAAPVRPANPVRDITPPRQ
jgi:hypothetical protein